MLYLGAKRSALGSSAKWTPRNLFRSNEQGAWYEPSLTNGTLFQDSAGTLPVTAVGQPVGLMLDKRLGLVQGAEVCQDPGFNNPAAWNLMAGMSIAGGGCTYAGAASGSNVYSNATALIGGGFYEVTFTIGSITSGGIRPYIGAAYGTLRTAPGTYTERITAGTTNTILALTASGITTCALDNFSVKQIPGNHATQPTAINRPVLQIDGNGKYYLAFNGTNSWMSTGSIDFTATDKMTVVAGVRKASDAAEAMLIELSANASLNAGTFNIFAPGGLSVARDGAYVMSTGGTIKTAFGPAAASYAAPITNVVSAVSSISGDSATLRVNGVTAATKSADQGTGNFGSYPIYIGYRAGTSLFFNGNLYSLVIRGALSNASQITAAESYTNSKTGAY